MNNNYIDDLLILYINLDFRKEKSNKMIQQFKEFNIKKYERVEGINGKTLKPMNLKHILTDNLYLTRGQIGCYFSHKKCYEKCLKSNCNYVLILEDDVQLYPDFDKKINEILNKIKTINDFDFLYLSRSEINFENMYEINNKYYFDTEIYSPKYCGYGFHSYILSKNGCNKFLKILNLYEKENWENNIGIPIDCLEQFKNFGLRKLNINLNIYSLRKYITKAISNYSDTYSIK